jgi:hypothetical protein
VLLLIGVRGVLVRRGILSRRAGRIRIGRMAEG